MTLSLLWLAATHDRPSAGELFLSQAQSSRTTGTCTLLGLNERGEHQQYEFPCTTFDLSHSAFSGIYAMVAKNCTIILDRQTLHLQLLGLDNCQLSARNTQVQVDKLIAEKGSKISLIDSWFKVMAKSQVEDSHLDIIDSHLLLEKETSLKDSQAIMDHSLIQGEKISLNGGSYTFVDNQTKADHLDAQYAEVLFNQGYLRADALTTRQGKFRCTDTDVLVKNMTCASTEAAIVASREDFLRSPHDFVCSPSWRSKWRVSFTVQENFIIWGGKFDWYCVDLKLKTFQSKSSSALFYGCKVKAEKFLWDGSHRQDYPSFYTSYNTYNITDMWVTPFSAWAAQGGNELQGSAITIEASAEEAANILNQPALSHTPIKILLRDDETLNLEEPIYPMDVTIAGKVNLNNFPGTRGRLTVRTTLPVHLKHEENQ